jgi:pyruvate/2-oxoglutarate dehydrogenase complex dihydrolipoamide acyltransferase (E2) component
LLSRGFEILRKAEMNEQTNKFPHLPLLLGGIAAILVSGIALGSLAISAPGFSSVFAPAEPPDTAAAPTVASPAVAAQAVAALNVRASRCAECGVIESTREVDASADDNGVDASDRVAPGNRGEIGRKPVRNHEIIVRLRDGSVRVITDPKPANWRRGERVTIIAGVN